MNLPYALRFARVMFGYAAISFVHQLPSAQAAPPAGYQLVWSDEFSGTSLDTTHWYYNPQYPWRDGHITNNAVSVANGAMTITTYTENGKHYTGYIGTRFKYQPLYGYMEARIRVVNTPGNWSAFWMFVDTVGKNLTPHTDGTEPDIMEHRAVDYKGVNDISNQVQSALHWDGYLDDHKSVSSGLRGAGLATGYHTYAMEWTPEYQKFYIDGAYEYTITNSTNIDPVPPLTPVSQRSQFFYLTTEIETDTWAGDIPAAGYGTLATSITKMDVDYIRVYQLGPPTPTAPTSVTAANISTGVRLVWDMVDNAPNYRVKRSTTNGGPYTTIATTGIAAVGSNYIDTSAVPGTVYYYVITAINGSKESPNSQQVTTSMAGASGSARSGLYAAKGVFSGTATYASVSQTANVVSNSSYEAGIWAKGSGRARLLVTAGTTNIASVFIDATPTWTYYSVPFNTGSATQVKFVVNDSSITVGSLSVDDAFLGVPSASNALANPGFESGAASWGVTAGSVWSIGVLANNVYSGLWSSKGVFTGGTPSYASVVQTANVTSNTNYQAGFWAKGTGRIRLLVVAGGTNLTSMFVDTTPTWTYYSLSFNTGANTQLKFQLNDSSTVAGTVYMDGCFMGIPGGANVLANPDFENGAPQWAINPPGTPVFAIGQY